MTGNRDEGLPSPVTPLPEGPATRVLVLGDWGTGDAGQAELALAMTRVHADAPPHLVITVGDNFYPEGVDGLADPLWDEVFQNVYKGGFWDTVPFFPTLGNHDHEGSVAAQIGYSSVDPRWQMAGRYYTFDRPIEGGGTVRFVALDTEPIHEDEVEADIELDWLRGVFDRPFADQTIVYGHHALVSSGPHGGSDEMIDKVLPIVRRRADVFVAGHDHVTELSDVTGLWQAVCGGGGGDDNPHPVLSSPGSVFAFSGGGWCMLHVYQDVIIIELFEADGTLALRQRVRGAGRR